eukprot:7243596-Pyramimonas_sp.AAC.1
MRPYQDNDRAPQFSTDDNHNDKTIMCYECGATCTEINALYAHVGKHHPTDDHPTRWAHGTRCMT